jgi:hypothetical protein
MSIQSREQLRIWFLPGFQLIKDRITSLFDSFISTNDDIFTTTEILSAEQEPSPDFSLEIEHGLNAEAVFVQLEKNGVIQNGINVEVIYSEETNKTNFVFIRFSGDIGTDDSWRLNVLKIK